VYAAQFTGQSKVALAAAREMVEMLPVDVVADSPGTLDGFLATPLHALERFGRWDDILAEPRPDERFPVTTAFWHYSRALALSALGRVEESAAEQAELERALASVPESATIGNNTARIILDIGRSILAGELEYRRRNHEAAFTHLREAVAKDEALRYDEPWGWFQPAAHALGALLLEQGQVEEAEKVYRRDLERHPENGWALVGLEECLRRANRTDEADAVLARFRKSWERADVEIRSSCFCRVEG
jgi:tetratricopeptide (TPR) repeat protein